MDAIPRTDRWGHLYELLEQLTEWKDKPACLTAMAYQWSLAICECIRNIDRIPDPLAIRTSCRFGELIEPYHGRVGTAKHEYIFECCSLLLALSLGVGFRHGPDGGSMYMSLANKEYHLLMVETMSRGASRGTRIARRLGMLYAGVEDALYVWALGGHLPSLGSCAEYLGRIVKGHQISPGLRLLLIRAIGSMAYQDLERAGLEMVIDALDDLDLGFDEMRLGGKWPVLLKTLIRSQFGRERLPLRYWHLLENLMMDDVKPHPTLCRWDLDTMRTLETSQNWEKLEAWMRIVWISRLDPEGGFPPVLAMEYIERVTLSLFRHRPSAIPKFGGMKIPSDWPRSCLLDSRRTELQRICGRVM